MTDRLLRSYTDLTVDRREVLRYAGVRDRVPQVEELLDRCLEEYPLRAGKVAWRRFPVRGDQGSTDLSFAKTDSRALSANLEGCGEVVAFAATVGLGIDRLIRKYSSLSEAKALLFQAIGAQQVEELCQRFCDDMEETLAGEGLHLRRRFSPGYGDLPLTLQPRLLAATDAGRRLGITLSDSMLMIPSKSVTALAGISPREDCLRESGCSRCEKTDCQFREG